MAINKPQITILEGDNIDILPTLPSESVHAVITDPPYNLGFMGKEWDKDAVAFYPEFWEEVMRVMKPGAHLLAFGGSRTFHRMACAIEDAGFELRDCIMWIYGTGFPKSLDVSKAIDKAAGAAREVVGRARGAGSTNTNSMQSLSPEYDATIPATPEAEQWQGWGTALKPAFEPIIVARKPLIGTVAQNVLTHGTGALNIDACRVPATGRPLIEESKAENSVGVFGDGLHGSRAAGTTDIGRHPANVLHDGSAEVEAAFAVYGERPGAVSNGRKGAVGVFENGLGAMPQAPGRGDSGTASRFFYSAKANKEDRFDSAHPTVKPHALMQWLCDLVTPPGGTILDCFAGTGSTLLAAKSHNFNAIGIEREHEYVLDIQNKLKQRGFFI